VDGAAIHGQQAEQDDPTSLRRLRSLVPDRREPMRTPGDLRVLSWNLFHGRDFPPDPALRKLRSVLFRTTTHNSTHVQVNRSLYEEFAAVLSAANWDVCLLQEFPPRWAGRLSEQCQAAAYRALTSRNWLSPVRNVIAERNPDLMGAWEGGSNLTLVRPPWQIVEGTSVLLNPLRERRLRERRRLALTRLVDRDLEVCVGNLHLSANVPKQAAREAHRAAEAALAWARGAPVLLGGDFNVRPGSSVVFEDLCNGASLCGTTGPDGIDHILACSLETVEPPAAWSPQRRELDVLTGLEHRRLRLSDHAPVEARFLVR
jgi:endonuclease/exonuclease/phosphatase family metal-dependent hydrolase